MLRRRRARYEPGKFKKYENRDIKPDVAIDINKSDTLGFRSLKGIGRAYSRRIVKYRESLGGFFKIDQIAEVYGIDSVLFDSIKDRLVVGNKDFAKISLNTSTFEQLRKHPYISYQVARGVVNYREQHGNFTEIEQLRKLYAVSDDLLKKLSPYLMIE